MDIMKKMILGAVILISMGTAQINAQSISYGVKVESGMSNFRLSDMGGVKSKMGFGVSAGGFSKIEISRNFAIQSEILFQYQTSTLEQKGFEDRDFKYWGIESPIYAMGQYYTATGGRLYIGVGPYTGYGFSAKLNNPDQKLYKDDAFQHWDFGFKAQIGYEFPNGFQINAGYKMGLKNAIDEGDGKMRPQAVSLGVGYRF